jgi:beta-galactosidase
MDVPGPLGRLMGVRVDEWDARGPEVVNPVRLQAGADCFDVASSLLFELVIPQGAEVVGTYRADFYAGSPAVTRNAFGAGHGWYVAAGLAQEGVSWVVRRVLDQHGLRGPYADVPDLETTVRVAPDGRRLLFLLNHRGEPVELTARNDGVDLLSGDRIELGRPFGLPPYGVVVLELSSVDDPAQ